MEENGSLVSVKSLVPTPETLASAPWSTPRRSLRIDRLLFAELIKRLRILTLTLLPLEVDRESINDPTSRIITPNVISAYTKAAGNLVEAVGVPSLRRCVNILSPVNFCCQLPYCLLRARRDFMLEANRNPADYGENRGRGKLALYFFCLSSHTL